MKNSKFVASLKEMNKDTDVLVEDVISMGTEGVMYFVNEAVERGDNEVVYVVADDVVIAENTALLLNMKYEQEMELMMDANKVTEAAVKELTKTTTVEEDAAVKIASSEAAAKFLAKHSAGAKKEEETKVETTKEETKMKQQPKRRMGTTRQTETTNTEKEGMKVNTQQQEETKTTPRRRMSTGNTEVNTNNQTKGNKERTNGRRRLGRQESLTGSTFTKFDGPWYLNADLYPVLNRFEDIVENMADAELDIQEIRLVNPEEIAQYARNMSILVVVQIKSNGAIMQFPITDNSYQNSSSDLGCQSIGWIQTKNGRRPAFGHKRPNEMAITVKCSCGKEFDANTGYIKCSCGKKYDDGIVSVSHDNIEFDIKPGWVFEKNPHLTVPTDILALAMAIAQYDDERGLDMHGIAE